MDSDRGRIRRGIHAHKRIFISVVAVLVVIILVVVFEYEYVPPYKYSVHIASANSKDIGPNQWYGPHYPGGTAYYYPGNITSEAYLNQSGHTSFIKMSTICLQGVWGWGYPYNAWTYHLHGRFQVSGHLLSDLHPTYAEMITSTSNYPYGIFAYTVLGYHDKNLSTICTHSGPKYDFKNVTYFDFSNNYYNFLADILVGGNIRIPQMNSTKPYNATVSFTFKVFGLGRNVETTLNYNIEMYKVAVIELQGPSNISQISKYPESIFIKNCATNTTYSLNKTVLYKYNPYILFAIANSKYRITYTYNSTLYSELINTTTTSGCVTFKFH